jgi:nitroimidazol reductase NimA-like FMN-containing flavoprotein (pyridoxamine 5'-phosphate oxidase superfamily)
LRASLTLHGCTDVRSDQTEDPGASASAPDHDHRDIAPRRLAAGYANEGLTLYFLCGLDSQKAANLARDDRVSLTIDHDTPQVMDITGLSMAARAQAVTDPAEGEKILRLLIDKYPEQKSLPLAMPKPADVRLFRVTPMVISVLDYSKGFNHTDLVTC